MIPLTLSVVFDSMFDMNPQVSGPIVHPVTGALTAAFDGLGAVRDAALFGMSDDELESAIEGCHGVRARAFDTELALVAEADGRDLGRRLGAASRETMAGRTLRGACRGAGRQGVHPSGGGNP